MYGAITLTNVDYQYEYIYISFNSFIVLRELYLALEYRIHSFV